MSGADSARPKVAVVAPYYPPHLGGVERYAADVVAALRAAPDFDVVVITTGARRTVTDEAGVTVHRLPPLWTASNTPVHPAWLWQVRRLLDREGASLVQAHSPVPYLADVTALGSRTRPMILCYHAVSLAKGEHRLVDGALSLYERRVASLIFRRVSAVVAVTTAVADALPERLRSRSVVIPPGVHLETFVPAQPDRASHEPRLLYVGRMERSSRWKGVFSLLEAFALIAPMVPETTLVLVGPGDDVPALTEHARHLGLAGRVSFPGRLEGEDLVRQYQKASVLVLPSLRAAESAGMTLLEAMACGIPVVASDIGGLGAGRRLAITHGVEGLIVPPGDPDALAKACVRLLTRPDDAQKMGAAGRRAVEASYSVELQRRRHLELMREVLARRGRPITSSNTEFVVSTRSPQP
jgi:glycosyltransferase involved in cell wall biosynthesis